jgi:hypothetical protein
MEMNSINLTVRFLLEVVALLSLGMWSYKHYDGWLAVALAIAVPLIAVGVWGTFNVLGDPSRSGVAPVEVAGWIRLLIELSFFALSAAALYYIGYTKISIVFAVAVIVHHVVSYERVLWLLAH